MKSDTDYAIALHITGYKFSEEDKSDFLKRIDYVLTYSESYSWTVKEYLKDGIFPESDEHYCLFRLSSYENLLSFIKVLRSWSSDKEAKISVEATEILYGSVLHRRYNIQNDIFTISNGRVVYD